MKSTKIQEVLNEYPTKMIDLHYGKILTGIISKIYVINLQEDSLKRSYIMLLFKKLNISFSLVVVKKISDKHFNTLCPESHISRSEAGCTVSHLWCLKNAIEHEHRNCIIFEDDIILKKDFVNYFLELYNPNYDFLLLGAHDYSFAFLNQQSMNKDNLYRPHNNSKYLYGAHANVYSLYGAKIMYNLHEFRFSFFDKYYKEVFSHLKGTAYVCCPNLVVADISQSAIGHEHELLSKKENEYYKNCFRAFDFKAYDFVYLGFFINPKNSMLPLLHTDSYETFIRRRISEHFNGNNKKIEEIVNRLSMSFFNIEEACILLNHAK